MPWVLVNMVPLIDDKAGLLAAAIIERNRDAFRGVWMPRELKLVTDRTYLVFEFRDTERAEAVASVFRKLIDRLGFKAKYMVQLRKRIDPGAYTIVVPPDEW